MAVTIASNIKRDQEIAHRAREFIKVNRSFAIIGTPGAGKTTLVKAIMHNLDSRFYRPIWLSYAGCNRSGVPRILAEKVGLELNRKGLPPLHKLKRHLAFQQKEPGSPFPVMVGDESLDRTLRLESRRAIASRMATVFCLEPLTQDESKTLLARRLETAKAPRDLFANDAMELPATQCRGNRRELMNLGAMLCIEAHSREEKSITAELVLATAPIQ